MAQNLNLFNDLLYNENNGNIQNIPNIEDNELFKINIDKKEEDNGVNNDEYIDKNNNINDFMNKYEYNNNKNMDIIMLI